MKVLIVTEAKRDTGLGHLTRCAALYYAFRRKGVVPEYIVNGDSSSRGLLTVRKYKVFNWLKNKQRLFDEIKGADIAVMDSYLADIDLYKKISGLVKTPVYLDDEKRLDYPGGIVVNPAPCARKDRKSVV